jgi:phi LC3 family holin
MNLKLRFKNKATVLALATATVAFIYQICGVIGITPAISQNDIVNVIGIGINALVYLGILVDPTTKGVGDSDAAKAYDVPNDDAANQFKMTDFDAYFKNQDVVKVDDPETKEDTAKEVETAKNEEPSTEQATTQTVPVSAETIAQTNVTQAAQAPTVL